MLRFFRLQVCGFAAALSALLLISCDKKSEEAHCKQIESLFAMDNWDSLATGPPNKPFDGLELYDAPASSVIAGGVECRIMRTMNSFAETQTYRCNIPVTDSVVD